MTNKIAVTVASDIGELAPVDIHFGRAPYFLVWARNNQPTIEVMANSVQDAVHGAGTRAAAMMVSSGVTDVISGQFGPKAYSALEALNIRMWTAPEGLTAREALHAFTEGNLSAYQMKVFQ